MDKYTQLLYDFVTADEERLEVARDIHDNWEGITGELTMEFARALKRDIQERFEGSFSINVEDDRGHSLCIYKDSWIKRRGEHAAFAIAVEGLSGADYFLLWQDPDDPNVRGARKRIHEYLNSYVGRSGVDKHGLRIPGKPNSSEFRYWALKRDSGNDFSTFEMRSRILPKNRRGLVEDYVNALCTLATDLSPHVEKLVEIAYAEKSRKPRSS